MATCPACAEPIPVTAEVCPHCGISVHQYQAGGRAAAPSKSSTTGLVIILAAVALIGLLMCSGVGIALFLPAVQSAREAARRTQCGNNLRQIGLALHNYHDMYGSFPPAFVADAQGRPMHSWRVLILPQLGRDDLYQRYKFDEPWDGPNNSLLLSQIPEVYRCPSHGAPGDTNTAYAAPFGPKCMFTGKDPIAMMDVSDGLSNTFLVGEVTSGAGIPWMKPADVDVALHPGIGDSGGFNSGHRGGTQVLLGDGSVRFISTSIKLQTMQAIYTRNGSEQIGEY